jgi:tRNA-Thr(GGU) m(6)t(6)A37 methyltransferase TsaA
VPDEPLALAPLDVTIHPIGRVRTPCATLAECPKNPREAVGEAKVEIGEAFRPGLTSLEGCTHLWLITWLDRAPRDMLVVVPESDHREHGVFATRAPARPNPVGLHAVRLFAVEGAVLRVSGVDVVDGTFLIDIKPYFPSIDAHMDAIVGWHAHRHLSGDE